MPKHEQKTCPRCQSVFEYKTGSIEQCQCQTVSLDEAHLDYIHARYHDCLCATCLAELRAESNLQAHQIRLAALLGKRGQIKTFWGQSKNPTYTEAKSANRWSEIY